MAQSVIRLSQEALAHQHAGRIEQALSLFNEILQSDPSHPQANFSLGIAAYQSGQLAKSISHFRKAAHKTQKHPQVFQLLGLALMNSGDHPEAQKALRRAVALTPDKADYHAQLGDLYRLQRKATAARQCFDTALTLDPLNGYGLIGLGQLEVSMGNIDKAVILFEKSIETGQELPTALHSLALARTHSHRPQELDRIEKLLAGDAKLAPADQAGLHWAAGKIYYDLGDTPQAVHHYRTARRIRYEPFDLEAHKERLAFIKEVFNAAFFREREPLASTSPRPVFIFGMPRSGTTLTEQILARHTRVASGGELTYFRQVQNTLGLMAKPSPALERRLKDLGPREFKSLARNYAARLDGVNSTAKHVTDKMPHNFEMLWLMSLLFPKATFIHCVRSPADTCISLLSHALSPAHNYCESQKTLGHYFQAYSDLMEHWENVLPVNLHHVSYEDLVTHQETESRALVAAAGLRWEDACLEFYKNETPVTTFSNMQVRRPMYRSSIGRWKRHMDLLGDLFEALGPLAPSEMRQRGQTRAEPRAETMQKPANDALQTGKTG